MQWMEVWNDVFRKTGSEAKAYQEANGALNMEDVGPTPVTCVVSDVFPDWQAAGVYTVQVIRSGLVLRDFQGQGFDIEVTNRDLADAVKNFRACSRPPFLDYNHAITDAGVEPGKKEAIGWMKDLWVETLDGTRLEPADVAASEDKVLILKADYEVNEDANEKIKSKAYAFYSPSWFIDHKNEETGEWQGMTVIGGAATNRPYISGMSGFVAAAEHIDLKPVESEKKDDEATTKEGVGLFELEIAPYPPESIELGVERVAVGK